MRQVVKFFMVGAYLDKGQVAILTDAETVMPLNVRYELPDLWFETEDTLLAGEVAAVDCGEWDGIGPSPTVRSGITLRKITDEERQSLERNSE